MPYYGLYILYPYANLPNYFSNFKYLTKARSIYNLVFTFYIMLMMSSALITYRNSFVSIIYCTFHTFGIRRQRIKLSV